MQTFIINRFHLKAVSILALVFIVITSIVTPIMVSAQDSVAEVEKRGVVPCSGPEGVGGTPCDYNTLITGVQRLLTYLIYLATLIAVVMFVWAGFILITAGGNPGKKDQAKGIFKGTAIGFLFVIGAWLIVSTILGFFANDETKADLPFENIDSTQ